MLMNFFNSWESVVRGIFLIKIIFFLFLKIRELYFYCVKREKYLIKFFLFLKNYDIILGVK